MKGLNEIHKVNDDAYRDYYLSTKIFQAIIAEDQESKDYTEFLISTGRAGYPKRIQG